jgi:hypothetical protein
LTISATIFGMMLYKRYIYWYRGQKPRPIDLM